MARTQIHGGSQIQSGTITSDRLASGTIADDRLAEDYINSDGSVAFTGDQSMGGNQLTNVGNGLADSDAINMGQARALINGLDHKGSVRAASTGNVDISNGLENGDTLDGVTLATGDLVLLKDQSTGSQNGIYTVVASGAASRAPIADADAEVTGGLTVWVNEGTANGDTQWTLTTNGAITVGTTALTFTQTDKNALSFSGGLTKSGNSVTREALTGDVTASAGSNSTTIANNAVTQAKMADDSVGTAELIDESVTEDKLHPDVVALISGGGLGASNFVTRETPSGSVNGSNTAFTLANTPTSGTESVFLNGILQEPGSGNDYTISGGTVTFETAPVSGDKVRVSYMK